MNHDTIAAIATPLGRGGVGIIRISGPKVKTIAARLLGDCPPPRKACLKQFLGDDQEVLDFGVALFFPGPHSFTGEDVLELQGHGGLFVLDNVLQAVLAEGCRLARPGEFSERAFINDKIDLAQAEAIADLIDSQSHQAARSAMRSLQGEFSKQVADIIEQLIQLRLYVEAAIDFPEEEIDFLSDSKLTQRAETLANTLGSTLKKAASGVRLHEGLTLVIAGKPNAGKSTLLNRLSGRDSAIVTDIPGTTRDVMREHITLDGLPLTVIDTAGLRDSDDVVEREGIRRARDAIGQADRVLWLVDLTQQDVASSVIPDNTADLPAGVPITVLANKIDHLAVSPQHVQHTGFDVIYLSAKTGEGVELLIKHLQESAGFAPAEDGFSARRRHVEALKQAQQWLHQGMAQLTQHRAGELFAEDLRQAQHALEAITGQYTADDLLGAIFANFCIGK